MSDSWYRNGLAFECTRCGNCCRGTPGTVRVSEVEIRALATSLELERDDFVDVFTFPTPDGAISLREKPNNDCVFWEKEVGCTVYEDRPRQCRTWPFWNATVATPAHWADAAKDCPGMNSGPVHRAELIQLTIRRDGTSGRVPSVEELHGAD